MTPQPPNYAPYDYAEEAGQSFDLKAFAYTLLERAWVVLLCAAAAAFITLGYAKRSPRIYAATAILQVEQEKVQVLPGADGGPDELRSPEVLKTIMMHLQTRALLERVVATNRLGSDPRFIEPAAGGEATAEQLVGMLFRMVRVGLQPGTRLVNVTVEHGDPALAAQLANSMVKEYIAQNFEQHALGADHQEQFYLAEAKAKQRERVEAEGELQRYRDEVGTPALDASTDTVAQKLLELGTDVTDAEADYLKWKTEYSQVIGARGRIDDLLNVRSVVADPTVAEFKTKIAQHLVEFGNLKQRYKELHPKFKEAQNRLFELELTLTNAVEKASLMVSNAHQAAYQTLRDLKSAFTNQSEAVMSLRAQRARYEELQAKVNSAQELYRVLLKKAEEAKIAGEWEQAKVRVIQPAYAPQRPHKPDTKRILMMGFLAGPMLGLALAFGLEALDSSLKTPDQAESVLKQPVLAAIPKIRSVERGRRQLIMVEEAQSPGAEAFRSLRTALSMLGPETERRVTLFTSAVPEEGKTFCALNYACSLAQQGLKTVLLEADLRCPTVEASLGLPTGQCPGVADYLVGREMLGVVVQATEVPNFFYIPAGTRPPNPSELLAQESCQRLLKEALQEFDRVVIDSAPIQPVSDTLLLLGRVNTVCFVVRAGLTPRKLVQHALQVLQKAAAPLAGVVFNRLVQVRGQTYYDYSYYPQYLPPGTPKPPAPAARPASPAKAEVRA
jgi:capsular exopolysaccharide synthesis family protein